MSASKRQMRQHQPKGDGNQEGIVSAHLKEIMRWNDSGARLLAITALS
jgi:hypothetical protein